LEHGDTFEHTGSGKMTAINVVGAAFNLKNTSQLQINSNAALQGPLGAGSEILVDGVAKLFSEINAATFIGPENSMAKKA